MQVTWTVKVSGRSGQQMLCRNEEEAARLVLELILQGVHRKQIIVDGVFQDRQDMSWIWDSLAA
jgi:hypothetical protein